jgi:miniconductance mechanosensitive channel
MAKPVLRERLEYRYVRHGDRVIINRTHNALASKSADIQQYNREHECDQDDMLINGRRQTNIGIFRAYAVAYLKSNPNINQDMTFLVRQLAPTETGLPLEIYVFSSDQRWAQYEDIQSDIFDHLLAALPLFDLLAFQAESDRVDASRDAVGG